MENQHDWLLSWDVLLLKPMKYFLNQLVGWGKSRESWTRFRVRDPGTQLRNFEPWSDDDDFTRAGTQLFLYVGRDLYNWTSTVLSLRRMFVRMKHMQVKYPVPDSYRYTHIWEARIQTADPLVLIRMVCPLRHLGEIERTPPELAPNAIWK